MRTLFLVTIILVGIISCSKVENPTPAPAPKQCNCGVIANDGIDNNPTCYWLEVRNECSGNKKKFCFDQDIWLNSAVGTRICITTQPW